MGNAHNELVAYLCETDFHEMYGSDWPQMAQEQARLCRAIAAAATQPNARTSWLGLATQYESTAALE
jgi:hypothetical protein